MKTKKSTTPEKPVEETCKRCGSRIEVTPPISTWRSADQQWWTVGYRKCTNKKKEPTPDGYKLVCGITEKTNEEVMTPQPPMPSNFPIKKEILPMKKGLNSTPGRPIKVNATKYGPEILEELYRRTIPQNGKRAEHIDEVAAELGMKVSTAYTYVHHERKRLGVAPASKRTKKKTTTSEPSAKLPDVEYEYEVDRIAAVEKKIDTIIEFMCSIGKSITNTLGGK